MELKCEVVSGHDEIKEIRNRETQEIRALKQTVYAHIGDAYPQPVKVTVSERIPPGNYLLRFALRVGKFGGVEVNDFQVVTVVKRLDEQKVRSA